MLASGPGDELTTPKGQVLGLLLGVHSPKFTAEWKFPAGTVKVITVKVLHPSELAFVVDKGEKGREKLKALFIKDKTYHISSVRRKPAVS